MSRLLTEENRIEYEYLYEHCVYMGKHLGAKKVDFHMSLDPERPRYEVYIEMPDGHAFQFQCQTMKEFMVNMYGPNPVPSL